jgi:GNAT superfamily N-acetyltransferase
VTPALRPVAFCEHLFGPLLVEAETEAYRFMERLRREWLSGIETFDKPGEILVGAFDGAVLIGVGGVSLDPYDPRPGLARLRHLYVLPRWRNQGVGEKLIACLVSHAKDHFAALRLSSQERPSRLYERLGFSPEEAFKQTHILRF